MKERKIENIMETKEMKSNNSNETKIKVKSAEIIVRGTADKPYFEIKYYDITDRNYHIGYGSYNLNYVFDWLKECFEIVE